MECIVKPEEIGGVKIGGSPQGAINEKNDHQGQLEVALRLQGQALPLTPESKAIMDFGTKREPEIIDQARSFYPEGIETPKVGFEHPEYEFLVAHVDGIAEDTIIEAKYSRYGFSEVPEYYKLQVNFYCGMLGKSKWHLVMLDGGGMYHHFRGEFDQALYDEQIKKSVEFWQEYGPHSDKLPKACHRESSSKCLKMLHPEDNGESLEKMAEINQLVIDLEPLKKQKKDLDKQIAAKENRLKQLIGDASEAETDLGYISYKKTKDGVKWKTLSKVELSDEERQKFTEKKEGYRVLRFPKNYAK